MDTNPMSHIHCKRIHFTPEEDEILKMLVKKYGEGEWSRVSREMPNRSTRQCRERWQNHLNVNVYKGKWSRDEDALLKLKYQELGPKWKAMEQFFLEEHRLTFETDLIVYVGLMIYILLQMIIIQNHKHQVKEVLKCQIT